MIITAKFIITTLAIGLVLIIGMHFSKYKPNRVLTEKNKDVDQVQSSDFKNGKIDVILDCLKHAGMYLNQNDCIILRKYGILYYINNEKINIIELVKDSYLHRNRKIKRGIKYNDENIKSTDKYGSKKEQEVPGYSFNYDDCSESPLFNYSLRPVNNVNKSSYDACREGNVYNNWFPNKIPFSYNNFARYGHKNTDNSLIDLNEQKNNQDLQKYKSNINMDNVNRENVFQTKKQYILWKDILEFFDFSDFDKIHEMIVLFSTDNINTNEKLMNKISSCYDLEKKPLVKKASHNNQGVQSVILIHKDNIPSEIKLKKINVVKLPVPAAKDKTRNYIHENKPKPVILNNIYNKMFIKTTEIIKIFNHLQILVNKYISDFDVHITKIQPDILLLKKVFERIMQSFDILREDSKISCENSKTKSVLTSKCTDFDLIDLKDFKIDSNNKKIDQGSTKDTVEICDYNLIDLQDSTTNSNNKTVNNEKKNVAIKICDYNLIDLQDSTTDSNKKIIGQGGNNDAIKICDYNLIDLQDSTTESNNKTTGQDSTNNTVEICDYNLIDLEDSTIESDNKIIDYKKRKGSIKICCDNLITNGASKAKNECKYCKQQKILMDNHLIMENRQLRDMLFDLVKETKSSLETLSITLKADEISFNCSNVSSDHKNEQAETLYDNNNLTTDSMNNCILVDHSTKIYHDKIKITDKSQPSKSNTNFKNCSIDLNGNLVNAVIHSQDSKESPNKIASGDFKFSRQAYENYTNKKEFEKNKSIESLNCKSLKQALETKNIKKNYKSDYQSGNFCDYNTISFENSEETIKELKNKIKEQASIISNMENEIEDLNLAFTLNEDEFIKCLFEKTNKTEKIKKARRKIDNGLNNPLFSDFCFSEEYNFIDKTDIRFVDFLKDIMERIHFFQKLINSLDILYKE